MRNVLGIRPTLAPPTAATAEQLGEKAETIENPHQGNIYAALLACCGSVCFKTLKGEL
jgi:hypothetical protein